LRIAIVGAGAIGCLFGIRLHQSGHYVLLIHHDRHTVSSIRKKGVILREGSRKVKAHVDARQSISEGDRLDLIVLAVKAYDTETVARSSWKKLEGETPILTLQNGLGNVETLCRYFRKRNVLAGTTTEAALATGPGDVTHTGKGLTWIGELDGKPTKRSRMIVDAFRRAGFRTLTSRNIEGVIWSKAIVNSAINPISALARVSNNELHSSSDLKDAAVQVIREGISVAKAHGVSPTPSPMSMLLRVLASSGRNRSSMLRDVEAGRRTEIRQLSGTIALVGRRLGVPVPLNTLMSELVLGLKGSQAPS
jgi:2-dehydropantoate 2-reductase